MTTAKEPPIVLLCFANDLRNGGRYMRQLADEAHQLREIFEKAESLGLCRLIVRQNTRLDDVFDLLRRYRHRIVLFHFAGHAGDGKLLFQSKVRDVAPAHSEGFSGLLGRLDALGLVFLNGCSTQDHVDHLLAAGAPAILATAEQIDDSVATRFATAFYQELVGGLPLAEAYEVAKREIKTSKGSDPREVYHQKYRDSEVSEVGEPPWRLHLDPAIEETARAWSLPAMAGDPCFGLPSLPPMDLPDEPYKGLGSFRRDDAPIFFGRGHEIRALYEAFTNENGSPIVLLYGATGVGKSSLLAAGVGPRLEESQSLVPLDFAERGPASALIEVLGNAPDPREAWSSSLVKSDPPSLARIDPLLS